MSLFDLILWSVVGMPVWVLLVLALLYTKQDSQLLVLALAALCGPLTLFFALGAWAGMAITESIYEEKIEKLFVTLVPFLSDKARKQFRELQPKPEDRP